MFCPKCGRMNSDDDINCKGCGEKLHREEEKALPEKKKFPKWAAAAIGAAVLVAAFAGLKGCDAFAAANLLMIL